jgi:hypothetical protein
VLRLLASAYRVISKHLSDSRFSGQSGGLADRPETAAFRLVLAAERVRS